MHNLKLFVISLVVIVTLAGIPHLVAEQTKPESKEVLTTTPQKTLQQPDQVEKENNNVLLGKWKVTYDPGEFKGAAINKISEHNGKITGVTVAYMDEYGNVEEANDIILEITAEKTELYKGVYRLDYEGESYKVPCKIQLVSETQLRLSYDYYGYADTEIWNKIP
ncbi:hypothetical protein [Flagellimonas sp. 2504JD4-2]